MKGEKRNLYVSPFSRKHHMKEHIKFGITSSNGKNKT